MAPLTAMNRHRSVREKVPRVVTHRVTARAVVVFLVTVLMSLPPSGRAEDGYMAPGNKDPIREMMDFCQHHHPARDQDYEACLIDQAQAGARFYAIMRDNSMVIIGEEPSDAVDICFAPYLTDMLIDFRMLADCAHSQTQAKKSVDTLLGIVESDVDLHRALMGCVSSARRAGAVDYVVALACSNNVSVGPTTNIDGPINQRHERPARGN